MFDFTVENIIIDFDLVKRYLAMSGKNDKIDFIFKPQFGQMKNI